MRISDWSSDVCSSDLTRSDRPASTPAGRSRATGVRALPPSPESNGLRRRRARSVRDRARRTRSCGNSWRCRCRSEEHTSELQSLMRISYAVFCLKKKKKKTNEQISHNKQPHLKTDSPTYKHKEESK